MLLQRDEKRFWLIQMKVQTKDQMRIEELSLLMNWLITYERLMKTYRDL